jgi:uncharacterized membrane protein
MATLLYLPRLFLQAVEAADVTQLQVDLADLEVGQLHVPEQELLELRDKDMLEELDILIHFNLMDIKLVAGVVLVVMDLLRLELVVDPVEMDFLHQ